MLYGRIAGYIAIAAIFAATSCSAVRQIAQVAEPPCYGTKYDDCLQAQTELASGATGCEGSERRICLMPLGRISPDLVRGAIDAMERELGLTISVITPASIPKDLADPARKQIDSRRLLDHIRFLQRQSYDDPNVVLIGLTPVDIYDSEVDYRFVFGYKGTAEEPKGVISTFRMDPRTFGESRNDNLLHERVGKFLARYVGLLYYGLSPSPDPASLLFDNILSLDDVDRMGGSLPITPKLP